MQSYLHTCAGRAGTCTYSLSCWPEAATLTCLPLMASIAPSALPWPRETATLQQLCLVFGLFHFRICWDRCWWNRWRPKPIWSTETIRCLLTGRWRALEVWHVDGSKRSLNKAMAMATAAARVARILAMNRVASYHQVRWLSRLRARILSAAQCFSRQLR